ncbi:MAG: GNAT family N-acetyltransferase [Lapillicoccus sp.]
MPTAQPSVAPTLTGGTVTLRPVTPADVSAIVDQSLDVETVRWTSVPPDYTDTDARAYLQIVDEEQLAGRRTTWAVEHEGEFAGLVALRTEGDGVAEVSFASHPAHRGRGLTTAAVRLLGGDAFENGAQVVLWNALVGNFASRRVAWKAGFRIAADPVWRTGPAARGARPEQVWAGRLLPGEPMEPSTRWLSAPTIEGNGIRLRPFRDADVVSMPVEHDASIRAYSASLPTRETYDTWLLAQREREAGGHALSCAVADAATDALLGGVDISRLDLPLFAGTGILGFWLLPGARGRGVLGQALELVIPYAWRPASEGGLGLHQLTAGCAAGNRASARVLRRAGFVVTGMERQAIQVDGLPDDALVFDLLAADDREAQRVEPGDLPVIETERFRLRPWTARDAPGPDEGPDADSRRFMPSGAHPDASTFPAWLRRRELSQDANEHLNWAIADRQTDRALGNLTVFRLDPVANRFQAEIGYWLYPTARGRGVLSEVMPAMVDHAFAPVAAGGMGLARLYAETDLDNGPSQAVLLRAGFRRWGQDRYAYRNAAGDVTDGAYLELLATDERLDRRPQRVDDVTLEGGRVRLRPWRDDDAERVVEGCTDERSRHWLAGLPQPYTTEHAAEYIRGCRGQAALGAGLLLALADPADDVCVGSVSLTDLRTDDPTTGTVGYWTHPSARGSGVTTEAVGLLVAHAFRPTVDGGLGLRRLELQAAAGNIASQRVAEVNGFHRAGVRRRAEHLGDGSYDDLVDYDLLVTDGR